MDKIKYITFIWCFSSKQILIHNTQHDIWTMSNKMYNVWNKYIRQRFLVVREALNLTGLNKLLNCLEDKSKAILIIVSLHSLFLQGRLNLFAFITLKDDVIRKYLQFG